METLKNKVALVTGAGSGIGKAIAQLYAAEGATVILTDINQANIEAVMAQINTNGGNASCFPADVSNENHVIALMEYVAQKFKILDILVNNAGVMDSFMPLDEVNNALWNKVIGINLNGPFYTCRLAIKLFLKNQTGVIINIASIGGLCGGRAGAAYTAAKHGLIGLTKSVGYQYAKKGIRCNAIAPGAVATNIVLGMETNPFGFDRMDAGAGNNPRTADPQEIAGVALFLASDQSSFINGSVVVADGGWTAY